MQSYALKLSFVQVIGAGVPKGVVNYLGSVDLLDPHHYHQHTEHVPIHLKNQLHVSSASGAAVLPAFRVCATVRALTRGLG